MKKISLKKNKVLIVGTVALDSIETEFGKVNKVLGGSAPYIALACAYSGSQPQIISTIGRDMDSDYLKRLQDHNVDTSAIELIENKNSFYWSGKYHEDLNKRDTIVTELNVLEDFEPVLADKHKNVKYVMLGNLNPRIQLSVLDQLNDPKFIVLDTMNYWMEHTWDQLQEVIKRVDAIVINDEEAFQLTKEKSILKSAKIIQKKGPRFVVIKKGEHGAFLFNKNKSFFVPANLINIVKDPTGAGDTFAGGFIGVIASCTSGKIKFKTVKKAVAFGSVMSSFTVQEFGTKALYNLSDNQIKKALKMFYKLTSY